MLEKLAMRLIVRKKAVACRKISMDWADKWQMQFNLEKRVAVHLGRTNKATERQ